MDGDGGSSSRERGPPHEYVLAVPAMASLAVVASHLDAAVPRRPRSYLPRAVPMGWWEFRLPVLPPPPPPPPPPLPPPLQAATEEGARRTWSPPRVVVAPPLDPSAAVAVDPAKKPPKRARRCLNCDAIETPQWRSGPMGKSTLCNACGVRLRAVGTLLEQRPAARTMAEPLPRPVSPESPPDSPIWTPNHKSSSPDIYLVRKTPKPVRPPIKKQQPSPAPAPKKKKKQKKKRSCVHCGSTETPQWREGPMGRGTLCNACGVRYRQGRLLPEYRPKGSPTFSPSEHASNHRQVLELRRQQRQNNRCPPPTAKTVDSAVAQPILDEQQPVDPPQEKPTQEEPVAAGGDGGGDATSSLDALLLDGPSAPLIVDGDDFVVSLVGKEE